MYLLYKFYLNQRYFERFKNLLIQCPHHGIEKWRQCQIFYDGLDYQNKTLLEIMCQGRFFQKDENQGWDLFEDLARKKPSNWNLLLKILGTQILSLQNEVSIQ